MTRVLVVDDSIEFLAAAAEVVTASDGFELAGAAQTGEEAVELARVHRPELALIDLNIPVVGGEETAGSLAVECPETVTVLMTPTPGPTRHAGGVFDKRNLSPAALAEIWERAQRPGVPEPG